jgi:hypothetical protein
MLEYRCSIQLGGKLNEETLFFFGRAFTFINRM